MSFDKAEWQYKSAQDFKLEPVLDEAYKKFRESR